MESLLPNSDKKGRLIPILLCTTIIFLITTIIFVVLYVTKKCNCECKPINPIKPEHFIPIKEAVFDDIRGAAQYIGKNDIIDNTYYPMTDFYNLKNTDSRLILEHFKTYQQSSSSSAHCAALMMVFEYYGDSSVTERGCMLKQGWTIAELEDEELEHKKIERFTIESVADIARKYGYNVTTSIDYYNESTKEYNFPFDPDDSASWGKWIQDTLRGGEPIIIQSADWLGTSEVIFGYDDMGTKENYEDDVLLLSDPYDTSDFLQDGYVTHSLSRFFEVWRYINIPVLKGQDDKYLNSIFMIIHKKASHNP